MIWLILLVLAVIMLIGCFIYIFIGTEGGVIICGFLSLIFGVLGIFGFLIAVCGGYDTYPDLKAEYTKIQSLRQRVGSIKQAYYPSNSKKAMIAGSIENFKQSTNLFKYVEDIAKKEAEYNSDLSKALFYRESTFWNLFGRGYFISDEIEKLRYIE